MKEFFNALADPSRFFLIFTVAVFAMLKWREFFTAPKVALTIFFGAVVFFVWAIRDPGFKANITKPDNIPIIFMLFLVGFFSWLSLYRAVKNDRRIDRGELPEEAVENPKKVLTWPDLVYSEFLCMLIGTAVLLIWALLLKAPLEEPANPNKTPNPSKAPWYFLGLQELLTMFHPMVAGVTIPGMGLFVLGMAPYVDKNPSNKPEDRKFAISLMTVHLMFWSVLVMIGSFFRGPGFNFVFPWTRGLFFEL